MASGRRAAIALAVVALTAWAAWLRWRILDSSSLPLGVDGYFYAVELRGLLEGHGLVYPSAPLGLWWLWPFAALTDPIRGAKLGAALGGGLAVVPVFFLGRRLGGAIGGLVAAALVATSATATYLVLEFVKQGLGLTLALAAAAAVLAALDRSHSTARASLHTIGALGLVAGTALCHKLALVVLALLVTPSLIGYVRDLERPARRAALLAAVPIGLGVAALAALAGWSARDLAWPGGLFGGDAAFDLPVLLSGGRALYFQHEVAIAGGLALVVLALVGVHRSRAAPLALAAAALGLALACPWLEVSDPEGIGFRLRLVAFVPLALCAAALVGAFAARRTVALGALGFALGIALLRSPRVPAAEVVAHPAMVAAVERLAGAVPTDAVIVTPERQLVFMVEWYARIDARLQPGDEPRSRRWRLLPMASMSASLRDVLERARAAPPPGLTPPRSLHRDHPQGLVAMPEATWTWALDRLGPFDREHYRRWPTH